MDITETYDLHQQVTSLSWASNGLFSFKGSQSDLQSKIQAWLAPIALPAIGNDWKVVWGPTVWKDQPGDATTGPDHVWYVAKREDVPIPGGGKKDFYVVAIAGTAKYSKYDQNLDVTVGAVNDFQKWMKAGVTKPPQPEKKSDLHHEGVYISMGTAQGVYNLVSNPAPSGSEAAGQSIIDFLKGINQGTALVVYTGHSLGGALSTPLALALLQEVPNLPPMDVLTYPTASPTPGNGNFVTEFRKQFPGKVWGDKDYECWNANVINTLDIVPMAWNIQNTKSNMHDILKVYGTLPPDIKKLVNWGILRSKWSFIKYTPIPSVDFTPTDPIPHPNPKNDDEFWKDAGVEHMVEYKKHIKTPDIPPISPGTKLSTAIPPILIESGPGSEGEGEDSEANVEVSVDYLF